MTNNNFSQIASFIWSVADLLRGDFKQSHKVALSCHLPCCVVWNAYWKKANKAAVLTEHEKVSKLNLPKEAQEKLLLRATNGLAFFNTCLMDLSKMGQSDIKANLSTWSGT